MRRTDDAKSRGFATFDETAQVHDDQNAPKLPTDVARACYALALAVLDGDHEHARVLARAVIAGAIEKVAGQG